MKKAYIKPEITVVNVETITLLSGSIGIDPNGSNSAGQRIGGFGEVLLDEEDW